MKNIHILPTDKPSNGYILGKCIKELSDVKIGQFIKTYYLMFSEEYFQPQNIYITNDEKPKLNDWFLDTLDKVVFKVTYEDILTTQLDGLPFNFKKIILTTDQDLIKDGVQAIDDEFLEWFVKNPSCEEVVFSTYHVKGDISGKLHYKVIIPKEEAFKHKVEVLSKEEILANRSNAYDFIDFDKQETLEEGAENYSAIHGERYEVKGQLHFVNTFMDVENAFVAGAKWQKEQDKNKFSEEEIRNIAEASFSFYRTNEFSDDELEVEWRNWLEKRIELLKKK